MKTTTVRQRPGRCHINPRRDYPLHAGPVPCTAPTMPSLLSCRPAVRFGTNSTSARPGPWTLLLRLHSRHLSRASCNPPRPSQPKTQRLQPPMPPLGPLEPHQGKAILTPRDPDTSPSGSTCDVGRPSCIVPTAKLLHNVFGSHVLLLQHGWLNLSLGRCDLLQR